MRITWVRAWCLVTISVVLAVLVTRWGVIVAGHPAYLVTLVVVGGAAVTVLVVSVVRGRAPAATSPWRWVARVAGAGAVVVVCGVLWWLRPFGATGRALESMDGSAVEITESPTRVELRPTGAVDPTGLVFYPGARVDARAYVPSLLPIAEAGHLVVIVKLPFWIGFTDVGAAASVIAAEDEPPDRWVVGGHSLGGATAAAFAGRNPDDVAGLLLWASYPASDLSARTDLEVLSVSASNDGLATPDDIDASRDDLPPDSDFVVVEGANHAQFGDYGDQPGDGDAEISIEDAHAQIAAASLEFLDRLDRAG